MSRYFDLPHPLIFAHRGASAHAPENTLAAFRLALEQGADGIELDAKLSADGVVVVMHDASLRRTTGLDAPVAHTPFEVIRKLDAGKWKGEPFAGEHVPTLEEVFASLGGKLLINVELTNYGHGRDDLVEKVVALVRSHQLENSVIFSSFTPANITRARALAPRVPAALLTWKGWLGGLFRSRWMAGLSPQGIHPYWTDVTPDMIRREKARGRFINVWTVNDPQEMRRLFSLGVDGIFTDDPKLARHVMEGV